MQFPIIALSVGVEEDLLPLSVLLHERQLRHRIIEQGGQQVLKVETPEQAQAVLAVYEAWRSGELTIELKAKPAQPSSFRGAQWWRYPVTVSLILLSCVGFLLFYLGAPNAWLSEFTFTPFTVEPRGIRFEASSGEYWRLITPAFLHFGWLHIVFNSLWLWELGTKVEAVMGKLQMLLLFVVIAVGSNYSQFLFGGPSLFGGMSGVVYGLLGFCWAGALLQPAWKFRPSRGVMLFMVGWLLVCMLGVVEGLGFGAVANAAHLSGLLIGSALGAGFGFLSRQAGDSDSTARL